jgi:hypothetical protein
MKKVTVLFILALSTAISCYSQDSTYILHPAIGEIIDRHEKTEFALFPEISVSRFEYSYIKLEGNSYWLRSYVYPDSLVVRHLDTAEIREIVRQIEGIIIANPDRYDTEGIKTHGKEARSVVVKTVDGNQNTNEIMTPGTVETISSEANSNERIKEDAERRKLVEQGSSLEGDGLYIDLSHMKKKKKK